MTFIAVPSQKNIPHYSAQFKLTRTYDELASLYDQI